MLPSFRIGSISLFGKKNSQKIKGMLLASPFYSQDGEQSGWIYLIRDNTNDFNSQTLINDAIASYEKLLNSVNSCISVVTHKPSGNILGMRNDLYVETMGSTVKGAPRYFALFSMNRLMQRVSARGRHLGLLDEEMVQRLREQNYTSRRISRNAPNCAKTSLIRKSVKNPRGTNKQNGDFIPVNYTG